MFLLTLLVNQAKKYQVDCFRTDLRSCLLISSALSKSLKTASSRQSKAKRKRGLLVDKIRIYARAGSGGMGCPSSGGAGGNGGDVFAQCVDGASLSQYAMHGNRRHTAEHGTHCKKAKSEGKAGRNKTLTVPAGTIIYRENNSVLKNLDSFGEKVLLVKGGKGGSHQTEKFNGIKGQKEIFTFELKLLGDVGLAGFPNAGKSTLLRSISSATPRVADYAFTTLRPTVGQVKYPDHTTVSYTDLPGLIEDAHLNRGMGHKFLRHIERTKAILIVVDINGFQLKEGYPMRTPIETIALLLRELYLYQNDLISRSMVLALNKIDTDPTGTIVSKIKDQIINIDKDIPKLFGEEEREPVIQSMKNFTENGFDNVVCISAKNGDGLVELTDRLRNIVLSLKECNADVEDFN